MFPWSEVYSMCGLRISEGIIFSMSKSMCVNHRGLSHQPRSPRCCQLHEILPEVALDLEERAPQRCVL